MASSFLRIWILCVLIFAVTFVGGGGGVGVALFRRGALCESLSAPTQD